MLSPQDLLATASPGGVARSRDERVQTLSKLRESLPTAEVGGIRAVGDEDTVRSWTACHTVCHRFITYLSASVKLLDSDAASTAVDPETLRDVASAIESYPSQETFLKLISVAGTAPSTPLVEPLLANWDNVRVVLVLNLSTHTDGILGKLKENPIFVGMAVAAKLFGGAPATADGAQLHAALELSKCKFPALTSSTREEAANVTNSIISFVSIVQAATPAAPDHALELSYQVDSAVSMTLADIHIVAYLGPVLRAYLKCASYVHEYADMTTLAAFKGPHDTPVELLEGIGDYMSSLRTCLSNEMLASRKALLNMPNRAKSSLIDANDGDKGFLVKQATLQSHILSIFKGWLERMCPVVVKDAAIQVKNLMNGLVVNSVDPEKDLDSKIDWHTHIMALANSTPFPVDQVLKFLRSPDAVKLHKCYTTWNVCRDEIIDLCDEYGISQATMRATLDTGPTTKASDIVGVFSCVQALCKEPTGKHTRPSIIKETLTALRDAGVHVAPALRAHLEMVAGARVRGVVASAPSICGDMLVLPDDVFCDPRPTECASVALVRDVPLTHLGGAGVEPGAQADDVPLIDVDAAENNSLLPAAATPPLAASPETPVAAKAFQVIILILLIYILIIIIIFSININIKAAAKAAAKAGKAAAPAKPPPAGRKRKGVEGPLAAAFRKVEAGAEPPRLEPPAKKGRGGRGARARGA